MAWRVVDGSVRTFIAGYRDIEVGRAVPRVDTIHRIAGVLGVAVPTHSRPVPGREADDAAGEHSRGGREVARQLQ